MRKGWQRSRSALWLSVAGVMCVLGVTGRAQNGVTWATNHYRVAGETLREIQRSMERAQPWQRDRSHAAVTEWNIRTRFAVAAFQGGFRCSGFTTETSIRITMPRWKESLDAPADVQSEWSRYYSALLEHEVGHGQMAVAAAAEMHRQVATLGTQSDPDILKQRADGLVAEVTAEYRQREAEYDRRTEHGATQGARLRRGPGRGESRRSVDAGNERGEPAGLTRD